MLVCFSVISLGEKGHRDARRRFRLRAEIKAHVREPVAGREAVRLPKQLMQNTSVRSAARNTGEAVALLNAPTVNSISNQNVDSAQA